MIEVIQYVNENFSPFWAAVTGASATFVFSCFVQALPDPEVGDGKWYRFIYKFLHLLAGNTKLVKKQNQEDKVEGKTLFSNGTGDGH